ncbi:MAG TPA: hypothetical protein VJ692_04755 [Nitrospiraceae bacterium]|nr:hypothetical protein [Nitrospiraceae bacterium]
MRRHNARDITEQHYRTLRLLLQLNLAEAHIVVRSQRPWPPSISFSPWQPSSEIAGDAIN